MMGVRFSDGHFAMAVDEDNGLFTVQIAMHDALYIETIPAESEQDAITKAHDILEKQTQEAKR